MLQKLKHTYSRYCARHLSPVRLPRKQTLRQTLEGRLISKEGPWDEYLGERGRESMIGVLNNF